MREENAAEGHTTRFLREGQQSEAKQTLLLSVSCIMRADNDKFNGLIANFSTIGAADIGIITLFSANITVQKI